ncbi:hypothetical protein [Legionella spiritensis]|uniref:hypothetical protein n=1 Tax=Legionella spiritensis TaxID=452 RepID=UPI000F6EC7F7|nr:hypothetical protein [Legionella spiritensis]VEG91623.1 Uncharacterised protein [Legionella spiritensis]
MTIALKTNEYRDIAGIVTGKLNELFPGHQRLINAFMGPAIIAQPLRISTPKTAINFNESEKSAIKTLRAQINEEQDKEKRYKKQQRLESMILLGQILFAQSACRYFLEQCQRNNADNLLIQQYFQRLQDIIEREGVAFQSSRLDALTRRKEFSDIWAKIEREIRAADLSEDARNQWLRNLSRMRGFYYQVNDLNFKYAQKPSRHFSKVVNELEDFGSKIALAASIIAIGATALSFIPPLAPVMGVIAFTAAHVSLMIGLPLALKRMGTILYNMIRFGAAPTVGEVIGTALLGTSMLLAGLSGIAAQAVSMGFIGRWAEITTSGLKAANNLTKASMGIAGQVAQSSQHGVMDGIPSHPVPVH